MVALANGARSAGVQADHHRTARPRSRASRQSATSTNTPCGDLARLWKAARPRTRSSAMMSARLGASPLSDTRCRPVPLHRREVVRRLEEPARRRDAELARDRRRRHLVDPRVPPAAAAQEEKSAAIRPSWVTRRTTCGRQDNASTAVGDLAGDAHGRASRDPAVDGADDRLGAGLSPPRGGGRAASPRPTPWSAARTRSAPPRPPSRRASPRSCRTPAARPAPRLESTRLSGIARRTIAAGMRLAEMQARRKRVRRVFM